MLFHLSRFKYPLQYLLRTYDATSPLNRAQAEGGDKFTTVMSVGQQLDRPVHICPPDHF
jgi:hypothetical protein